MTLRAPHSLRTETKFGGNGHKQTNKQTMQRSKGAKLRSGFYERFFFSLSLFLPT